MMQTNSKNYLYIFIVLFILLEGIFFVTYNTKLDNDYKKNEERVASLDYVFSHNFVQAKAYSVYDITLGKKIFSKNGTTQLPLASLAKSMSVAIALSEHGPNDEIVISKNALAQDGDFGLSENERWNIYDLAKLTLICSANDGAYAMLEGDHNYLQKMNSRAKKLGLNNTTFFNSTGLDISDTKAGAYASAEDANLLAIYALKANPQIFSVTTLPEITLKSDSGFIHNVKNTDTVLDKIPNIVFSKTGYTVLAGGNLTTIFKDKGGHYVVVTVLGSTFEGRFTDMEKLVNILQLSYGGGN